MQDGFLNNGDIYYYNFVSPLIFSEESIYDFLLYSLDSLFSFIEFVFMPCQSYF